jgi:hypothetical protein
MFGELAIMLWLILMGARRSRPWRQPADDDYVRRGLKKKGWGRPDGPSLFLERLQEFPMLLE